VKDTPVTFAAVAQPLADKGWRPFPGFQATKTPAMRGWPGLNRAEWDDADLVATIGDHQPANDFCCCLAVQPEIVAIDLDIIDLDQAATADRLANEILGRTPLVRIGLAPKQIRIYRNAGGIRSRKSHPVEVFSTSGQIIAFGWHAKANRPYTWLHASPVDLNSNCSEIPLVTQTQLNRFIGDLFRVVPRRLPPTRHVQLGGTGGAQTVSERLRMLTTFHGTWKRAAAIVLSEAVDGCRNDTAWIVIASAAGRGIPDDVIWELFGKHFRGWDAVSEDQVASMIERARPVHQASAMNFTTTASSGGSSGN
jgi:hypothetical protein